MKAHDFAVIGTPIKHSLSPIIHDAFAKQTNIPISYKAIDVSEENLTGFIKDFQARGGRGLNVTLPHKQTVCKLTDSQSETVKKTCSANTLIISPNHIKADNTDGIGMVRDITINNKTCLTDKKILILGAGGAVAGVLHALLATQPKQVIITNRTHNKALQLTAQYQHPNLYAKQISELADAAFDVIINGTSASLYRQMPEIPDCLDIENSLAYDMVYGQEQNLFLEWAEQKNARAVDGLGMLVEQAAESFYHWHQVRPDTETILQQLKDDHCL